MLQFDHKGIISMTVHALSVDTDGCLIMTVICLLTEMHQFMTVVCLFVCLFTQLTDIGCKGNITVVCLET